MDKLTSAGRSRGRGRATNPQQPRGDARNRRVGQQGETSRAPGQQGEPLRAPGPPRGYPTTAPTTSAWGQPLPASRGSAVARGSTVPQQPSCSTAPIQQRAAAPVMQGRATTHREIPVGEAPVVREDTRGAVRGKRVLTEVIASRPATCENKSGKTGKKVVIQTNYFRVLKKPQWSIHQYRVDFAPDIDMVRLRRAYLYHHKDLFGGYIFDGTVLFCAKYLENKQIELLTKNREGETIQIKIKHVGQLEVTDAQQLQVLNLILRRAMEGLNLQLVGRSFFDPKAKHSLDSYCLELWPGYQTSIRQHENDILLCAEIAHKVMRTDTVYKILQECFDKPDYQNVFKREVVGTIVLTDYNNKTYRVDDVDFNSSPMSKFSTKDGEISYMEYYKKRYNIHLKDAKQPLLVSRPTERNIRGGQNEFIMLIPELSRSTGLTNAMRSNFRLMRAMSEFTRLAPERRIERLKVFNRRLNQAPESVELLNSWSMRLDTNLVEVPGRIIPSCKIVFGNNKRYECNDYADWTREFRNNAMYKNVDMKRWYVIAPGRNLREVQNFVQMCIRAANGMQMGIAEPRYQQMNDDRAGTYSQAINTVAAEDPQLLMVVLVSAHEEKYSCIKKKCCVDRPVPSQVVTLRTIAPRGDKASGLMSVATKVVIQMNAKLMGAPWLTDIPISGLMTVGFDVCHSAKEKNKSYGALVATMDLKSKPHYFSAVSQHMKGQELSNEIGMNMTYALKAYRNEHGMLPKKILFYRDGVGDGQLHQVFHTEVKFLKEKLDEIYKNAGEPGPCPMAFIVVSKRINTRYFINGRNPPPGTVVDDIITLPERYDFFLVSQSVNQGTVSPTSYNVIYDTMGLDADKIQMLTYKMTHLYYNWSGTCRVPAVCQYAHKLAFLVAESLHRLPNNALEKQLYFL
ncbi:PREDICTED: protein aubergine [Rhagoletis zephyria]|uniref:protein aubergine n=1 Tax=Rhagoletis zephyria TaxID=28612 RepID=UPI000811285F|nr:PREDICTED: protein aubergine [Rhagoletis zephyria]